MQAGSPGQFRTAPPTVGDPSDPCAREDPTREDPTLSLRFSHLFGSPSGRAGAAAPAAHGQSTPTSYSALGPPSSSASARSSRSELRPSAMSCATAKLSRSPRWRRYLRGASRGDDAAATRVVHGDQSQRRRGRDADGPWGPIAATPRPRRGWSMGTNRSDAAAATRIFRGARRRRGRSRQRGDAGAAPSLDLSQHVAAVALRSVPREPYHLAVLRADRRPPDERRKLVLGLDLTAREAVRRARGAEARREHRRARWRVVDLARGRLGVVDLARRRLGASSTWRRLCAS